jgi:hypothetical protein
LPTELLSSANNGHWIPTCITQEIHNISELISVSMMHI